MGKRKEGNRTEFGVKRNDCTIEHRPGGTHPGAQHGAMRRSLMMGMVSGMFDRLRLSQSADGQDREHEKDRHIFENSVVHRKKDRVIRPDANGDSLDLSSRQRDT